MGIFEVIMEMQVDCRTVSSQEVARSVLDVFAKGSGSSSLSSLERQLTQETENSSDNSAPDLSLITLSRFQSDSA